MVELKVEPLLGPEHSVTKHQNKLSKTANF